MRLHLLKADIVHARAQGTVWCRIVKHLNVISVIFLPIEKVCLIIANILSTKKKPPYFVSYVTRGRPMLNIWRVISKLKKSINRINGGLAQRLNFGIALLQRKKKYFLKTSHTWHDGSYHHAKDGVCITNIQDWGQYELHIHWSCVLIPCVKQITDYLS